MTRRDLETPIHKAILAYLRLTLPRALVHHSPNSIGLSGARIRNQITKARDMGTVKGWPDLTIIAAGHPPLFMEVKAPGNYPDKDQRALHDALRDQGAMVAVVRSVDDARAMLNAWGAIA